MSYPSSTEDVRSEANSIRSIIGKSQNNAELNLARRRTRALIRSGTSKHLATPIRKTTKAEGKTLQREISRKSKEIA